MVLMEFNLILKTLFDYVWQNEEFIVLCRATVSRHSPFELNTHTAYTFDVRSLEEKKYSWL